MWRRGIFVTAWGGMLFMMSKRKKKPGPKPNPLSKRSQGVDRHTGRRVVFFLDDGDYDTLREHMAESPVELKLSAVMRRAVRLYLQSVGKRPPDTSVK